MAPVWPCKDIWVCVIGGGGKQFFTNSENNEGPFQVSRNILSCPLTPKSRERLLKWHNTRKLAYKAYFLLGDCSPWWRSHCAWEGGEEWVGGGSTDLMEGPPSGKSSLDTNTKHRRSEVIGKDPAFLSWWFPSHIKSFFNCFPPSVSWPLLPSGTQYIQYYQKKKTTEKSHPAYVTQWNVKMGSIYSTKAVDFL